MNDVCGVWLSLVSNDIRLLCGFWCVVFLKVVAVGSGSDSGGGSDNTDVKENLLSRWEFPSLKS